MEQLHTSEEILQLDRNTELMYKLRRQATQYNNSDCATLADKLANEIDTELVKYSGFIGKEALAPPSAFSDKKEYRKGKIESISHFYSNSVMVKFRYDSQNDNG